MGYVRPKDVNSPKGNWLLKRVLHDGGELKPTQTDALNWSAAEGKWKGDEGWYDCLALRWNGGSGGELGNPQSRGFPTWFIVPPKLEKAIRRVINSKKRTRPQSRKDVPWRKRRKIPDPQILDAADQYMEAHKLLKERSEQPGSGVLLPLMNTAVMAVELYLKSLSAEAIYVEDDQDPEVSRIYAEPARGGHNLVVLLKAMPPDVHDSIVNAFDAEFGARWNRDLRSVLGEFKKVLEETRYPFECGQDITRFDLMKLMELADFLGGFARGLPWKECVKWK